MEEDNTESKQSYGISLILVLTETVGLFIAAIVAAPFMVLALIFGEKEDIEQ